MVDLSKQLNLNFPYDTKMNGYPAGANINVNPNTNQNTNVISF
jgi:hypothetical protein